MALSILDLEELMEGGVFSEQVFLEKAATFDFDRFRGARVLVRGCQSTIVPPWAYMHVTARLVPVARSIRFGNDHDNIVVYRSETTSPAK